MQTSVETSTLPRSSAIPHGPAACSTAGGGASSYGAHRKSPEAGGPAIASEHSPQREKIDDAERAWARLAPEVLDERLTAIRRIVDQELRLHFCSLRSLGAVAIAARTVPVDAVTHLDLLGDRLLAHADDILLLLSEDGLPAGG